MNTQSTYTQFELVREMMETPIIIKNFKLKNADNVVAAIKKTGKIFFTGEGSSRIFPAKNVMYQARRMHLNLNMAAEGGRQAAEYKLDDSVVFVNGRSRCVDRLIYRIKSRNWHNCDSSSYRVNRIFLLCTAF